jgi:dTDP-4-dehydrorhamnose reductase
VPGDTEVLALSHHELDISDQMSVAHAVLSFEPKVIINAAAFTAVDQAETEPRKAEAFNADGPLYLAQAADRVAGCRMIQISTDYVFGGHGTRPHGPDDPTDPLSVYGRTKLEGEKRVRAVLGDRAVILRTSWVYAAEGKNFLLTMLRLMRERGSVRVVSDQRGSPTAARSVARALWQVAGKPLVHGNLHWTDDGVVSWYDFAAAIGEDAFAVGLLPTRAKVIPITTAEYPTAAQRPLNSALDKVDSVRKLSISPLEWRSSMRKVLASLRRPGASPDAD